MHRKIAQLVRLLGLRKHASPDPATRMIAPPPPPFPPRIPTRSRRARGFTVSMTSASTAAPSTRKGTPPEPLRASRPKRQADPNAVSYDRYTRNLISTCSGDRAPKTKKPAAGGDVAGFEPNSDWEEECRCSGRGPLGGVGRLKFEALREEVHCFDRSAHTATMDLANVSCRTAAMQEIQAGEACVRTRTKPTLNLGVQRKNARVISGRRAIQKDKCCAVSARSMRGQRCGCRRG
jgi:hypothetical protein